MENYKDINRKAYDLTAAEYNQRTDQYRESQKKILKPFVDELRKEFGEAPLHVIDVGCAVGLNLNVLDWYGLKTSGIDISPNMIYYASQRSPNSRLYTGALDDTSIDDLVHGVVMDAVIHLFPKRDVPELLSNVKTIMYPGAIGTVTTTYSEISKEGFFEKADYSTGVKRFRKYWCPEELIETLEEAGFELLDIKRETNYEKDWIRIIFKKPETRALENVVYICGVHATGKSTIINTLREREPFIVHPRSGHSTSNDFLERLRYRIKIYQRDALEQLELVKENPNKIVLGDRSVLDGLAYVDAFLQLGWIDEFGHTELFNLYRELFPRSLQPRYCIYVAPDLEWTIARMHERWKSEGVRWKDDDPHLLPTAHETFKKLYSDPQVPEITIETLIQTNHEARIKHIIGWLKKFEHFNLKLLEGTLP